MSTMDAARVLRIYSLHVPPAGGYYGDLSLDSTLLPAIGPATLTVGGDGTFVGRVTQAGMDDHPTGGALVRVTFEGGAGWKRPLTSPGGWTASGGVRLSTVLRDLAAAAGEAYDAPPEVLLPETYRWPASTPREPVTGAAVLADLMRRGAIPTWRVEPSTGRTVFTVWPSTGAADASVRVLSRNLARGRRRVGIDERVAVLLPGSTLEGVVTKRLIIHETASKLEAEVYER